MAILGLKEMEKFLWKGRKKSLPSWLSWFNFAFFLMENAKKNLVFHFVVERQASFYRI